MDGPPAPQTLRESVVAGLADALAIFNPFVVCALQAGLALSTAVVPWIPPATGDGPAPDRATTILVMYQGMSSAMIVAFVAVPVVAILAHLAGAAVARRVRSGAGAGSPSTARLPC